MVERPRSLRVLRCNCQRDLAARRQLHLVLSLSTQTSPNSGRRSWRENQIRTGPRAHQPHRIAVPWREAVTHEIGISRVIGWARDPHNVRLDRNHLPALELRFCKAKRQRRGAACVHLIGGNGADQHRIARQFGSVLQVYRLAQRRPGFPRPTAPFWRRFLCRGRLVPVPSVKLRAALPWELRSGQL